MEIFVRKGVNVREKKNNNITNNRPIRTNYNNKKTAGDRYYDILFCKYTYIGIRVYCMHASRVSTLRR